MVVNNYITFSQWVFLLFKQKKANDLSIIDWSSGVCSSDLLVEADDHILGFTLIGAEAGEVMAVVQTAMAAGLPYSALRDAILTHPTMAEGLNALFGNVPDKSG